MDKYNFLEDAQQLQRVVLLIFITLIRQPLSGKSSPIRKQSMEEVDQDSWDHQMENSYMSHQDMPGEKLTMSIDTQSKPIPGHNLKIIQTISSQDL